VANVSNNGSFTGGAQELTFDPYAPNQSATDAYALGGYNFSYPAYQAFALYESVGGSAVDGMGDIAFTDSDNNLVYLEAFSGGGYNQSTIGSGFNNPTNVAFDASGDLFILDAGSGRIIKETAAAGTYTQSVIATGLVNAGAMTVDGVGNVYVPQATSTFKLTYTNGTYVASSIPPVR
jgi:hypothetical protein